MERLVPKSATPKSNPIAGFLVLAALVGGIAGAGWLGKTLGERETSRFYRTEIVTASQKCYDTSQDSKSCTIITEIGK